MIIFDMTCAVCCHFDVNTGHRGDIFTTFLGHRSVFAQSCDATAFYIEQLSKLSAVRCSRALVNSLIAVDWNHTSLFKTVCLQYIVELKVWLKVHCAGALARGLREQWILTDVPLRDRNDTGSTYVLQMCEQVCILHFILLHCFLLYSIYCNR